MALVHESIGDFVLFPRDQVYHDLLHSSFDQNFAGFDSSLKSTVAMQQPFPDRRLTPFDNTSASPAYVLDHTNYHTAPSFAIGGSKEQARQYHQRHTPSGSASPSMSQSLDHPPSTLSSTSGASGQSTASSTVGSPYSLATHSLPSHDTWSEANQGLGIAPDIVHNDGFAHDTFSNSSLENDICFPGSKFLDSFVGECDTISSVLCGPNVLRCENSVISGATSSFPPSSLSQSMRSTIDPRLTTSNVSDQQGPFKSPVQPASSKGLMVHQPPFSHQKADLQNQPKHYPPRHSFFNQSNGRFIAPLESFCWFSLLALFIPRHLATANAPHFLAIFCMLFSIYSC